MVLRYAGELRDIRLEVSYRDLGDGRVLVSGTLHIRGQGSGIEAELPTAAIATFQDGTIMELKDHVEVSKALDSQRPT